MDSLSRRAFLADATAGGALAAAGGGLAAESGPGAGAQLFCAPLIPFRTSLSVMPSSEEVLEACTLTDGAYTARTVPELQKLYMRHGATEVYQRMATLRGGPKAPLKDLGWGHGLERARLARDVGLPFNPELMISAIYGDGATYQVPPDFRDYPGVRLPGPWLSLTLEQMLPPLRQYGAEVARQILATGVQVNVWDIGNEVESGIAGVAVRTRAPNGAMPPGTPKSLDAVLPPTRDYQAPDRVDAAIGQMSIMQLVMMPETERIAWCRAHLWPHIGRILAAVAEGIRSVAPHARVSTHVSPLGQKTPAVHLAFWRTMKEAGFTPYQFGFSYYPSGNHGDGPPDSMQWFKDTTSALKRRFGLPTFIAEGGYASGPMPPPYLFDNQVESYPISPAGQYAFNRDLIAWGVQSGCLAGYRPWDPDFCTAPIWASMAWFQQKGKIARARPVLHAFEDALPSLYLQAGRVSGGVLPLAVRVNRAGVAGAVVELRDGGRVLASQAVPHLGRTWTRLTLPAGGVRGEGTCAVAVGHAGRTVMERRIGV